MKKLKSGLHIAIVTNRAPGHGGSLFAWESYMSCKLNGIQAILATLQNYRIYPEIGSDLRYISLPNQKTEQDFNERALSSLHDLAIEAKDQSKFLIIDLHAGLLDDDVVFSVLASAGIAAASSVTLLLPVRYGQPTRFINLEARGIPVSRGLYRRWGFGSDPRDSADANTPSFPAWNPTLLTPAVIDIILPPRRLKIPQITESTVDDSTEQSFSKKTKERYKAHIADAVTSIWKHVLDPIQALPPASDVGFTV